MSQAPSYPLFLDLARKPVLIVGGGSVGLRKAKGLVECAARVTVVSPVFAPGFKELRDIERIEARYAATHMARKPWRLAFAATDVVAVNNEVQKHAEAAGILCCRADDTHEGDFGSGAVVRVGAGNVVVAVSTGGASPVLAGRICREAAAGVDPILPVWVELLAAWRETVKASGLPSAARRTLLQKLAGEEMEAALRRGPDLAKKQFDAWLQDALSSTSSIPEPPGGKTATRVSQAVRHGQ